MGLLQLDPDLVVWQEIDGELVVIDLTTSEYLAVTGAGAVAWPMLSEGTTLDQLVSAICRRYDVAEDRARDDVTVFLTTLRRRRLLRES